MMKRAVGVFVGFSPPRTNGHAGEKLQYQWGNVGEEIGGTDLSKQSNVETAVFLD